MKPGPSLRLLVLVATLIPVSAQAYATFGFKWGSHTAGEGAKVTWGYAADGNTCRVEECTLSSLSSMPGLPGDYRSAVNRAFDAWSAVADIDFTFDSGDSPDILIGAFPIDGRSNLLADSNTRYWLDNPLGRAIESDIRFDTADNLDSIFFNVLAHEIGHSLGLDHVDSENALMSRFVADRFQGPQADDIDGVQYLYGNRSTALAPQPRAIPVPPALWMLISGLGLLTATAVDRCSVVQALGGPSPRCAR